MQWLTEASSDELRRLVESNEFFWLDLTNPSDEQVQAFVEFGIDPEAAERALEFGATPQLRRFSDHIGMIFYGALPHELVEVHMYVSGNWVVTLHERPFPPLDQLRADLEEGAAPAEEAVVSRILEALADSFADLLDPFDEQIEKLEEQAIAVEEGRAGPGELRRDILQRRSRLLRALRLVRRQRDYIDRAVEELAELPGLEPTQTHELRDVAGQMIRVTDGVADALDRLAAALDLLNSAVSNRMNAVMERLTVVATIFLPLTAVTGFFGQNFTWLINHIDSFAAFLVFGILLFAGSGLGIYMWVRSRLEGPPTVRG